MAESRDGVIAAQGGREQGWAVHLREGRLAFDVRISGVVTRIESPVAARRSFHLTAVLAQDIMRLSIDGREVARGSSPGLIPVQPKDGLDIGRDTRTAAGDYEPPNPLQGTVSGFTAMAL